MESPVPSKENGSKKFFLSVSSSGPKHRYAPSILENPVMSSRNGEQFGQVVLGLNSQLFPTFLQHHHFGIVLVVVLYLSDAYSDAWETWSGEARTIQVPYGLQKLASRIKIFLKERPKMNTRHGNQSSLVKSPPGLFFLFPGSGGDCQAPSTGSAFSWVPGCSCCSALEFPVRHWQVYLHI